MSTCKYQVNTGKAGNIGFIRRTYSTIGRSNFCNCRATQNQGKLFTGLPTRTVSQKITLLQPGLNAQFIALIEWAQSLCESIIWKRGAIVLLGKKCLGACYVTAHFSSAQRWR